MILTYKIRHHHNFELELSKAKQVAKITLKTRTRSSADVRHIGLKSMIVNQILRKYANNLKAKHINKVVLTVPNQGITIDLLLFFPVYVYFCLSWSCRHQRFFTHL